ncbi:MAG: hypothetical protein ACTJHM_11270 [Agrococcus casei]|uniref:hypothetical protein n=1 Tax=Agrococcus casei TaxID=343512 RepID=UPI003F9153AD
MSAAADILNDDETSQGADPWQQPCGSKSRIMPDGAVFELNMRTYSEAMRTHVLDVIDRVAWVYQEGTQIPVQWRFCSNL